MSIQSSIKQRELDGVSHKLNGLIEAIADGPRASDLQRRLHDLVACGAMLETEIAHASPSATAPRLHPTLPKSFGPGSFGCGKRWRGEEDPEVLKAARALIDRLDISLPADGEVGLRIGLIGDLTSLLLAAGVDGLPWAWNTESPSELTDGLDMFACSRSGDAGTGFEPVTFRL